MENKKWTRRRFLRLATTALGAGVLAACAPKVVEVEKIVEKGPEARRQISIDAMERGFELASQQLES